MALFGKKWGNWLGLIGITLIVAVFIGTRIYYLKSHGQNIFWLAELFSPVALFCVVGVTFVDKLVTPGGPQKAPAAKKSIRRPRQGRTIAKK